MNTVQPQPSKLRLYTMRYLALKQQIDRERAHFHYPAKLVEEMTVVRNSIVEMQNARRKERTPLVPAELLTEGGDQQWI